jgi:hypothetical protein
MPRWRVTTGRRVPGREAGWGPSGGASVVDPFGNVLGIILNQHYLDVLTSKATA